MSEQGKLCIMHLLFTNINFIDFIAFLLGMLFGSRVMHMSTYFISTTVVTLKHVCVQKEENILAGTSKYNNFFFLGI
jgi:hypothetical protein